MDFNNDGFIDIVGLGSSLRWLPGTNSLTWGAPITIDSSVSGSDINVADLDGDGDFDILAALDTAGVLAFYENDGSQSFTKRIIDSSAAGVRNADVINLTNGGNLSVVAAIKNSNTLALYNFSKDRIPTNNINITHVNEEFLENETTEKLNSGTIYYFTARAQNLAGEYGEPKSSDGVLFIDPTPPVCMNGDCVIDDGTWTNSDSSLHAEWFFEDNESDIIAYEYSIGTAKYPNPGWNSIINRKKIGPASDITEPGLSLQHIEEYFWNVRAQNGNANIGYNGSWSDWKSSDEITVDLLPPTGGSIYYNHSGSFETVPFVTIKYYTGDDPSPQSGVDHATIVSGRSQLIDGICGQINDLDFAHYNVTVGNSYFNFPVESGYCYIFEMRVWDRAGNFVNYAMINDTLRIVKIDRTPPTTIVNVWDDGFFTFDRNQLHAWWLPQSDQESGMHHYFWRIYQDDTTHPDDCNISSIPSYPQINSSHQINCTLLTEGQLDGNVTNPEIYVFPLNLTNNFKYYFAVTPYDKAGNNASTTFSDGIIYIDNAPPTPLHLYSVNNATLPSSPYLTRNSDGKINITLYGDLDGFKDIDSCVLMAEDLDYIENTSYANVLSMCDISTVSSMTENDPLDNFVLNLTDFEDRDITKINCLNATNTTEGGIATQGIFKWHVSCRDKYWNIQSYNQNTPVWFEVDWIDPPNISGLDVYTELGLDLSNETVYCSATVSDLDNDTLTGDVNFTWFMNDELVFTETRSYNDSDETIIPHEYYYLSELDPQYTRRGSEIKCSVTAYDLTNASDSDYLTFIIQNAAPYRFTQLTPINESFKDEIIFSWDGPVEIDGDAITYTIQVDDQGTNNNPEFNNSDNYNLSYYAKQPLTIPHIPGNQTKPDVWQDLIVYMDNRSDKDNWDIYLYNLNTKVETAVAISSANEINPRIFDGYVVYEESDNSNTWAYIKKYEISTGIKTNIETDAIPNAMDYFGRYVAYRNGDDDVIVYDMVLDEKTNISNVPFAQNFEIYGTGILWDNTTSTFAYDVVSQQFGGSLPTIVKPKLWGPYSALTLAPDVWIKDVRSGFSFNYGGIDSYTINGNKMVFSDSGTLKVMDLMKQPFNATLGTGNNASIYDDLIVWVDNGNLYYARENRSLPAYWMIDSASATSAYRQILNTTDDAVYFWLIEACDLAYESNSCINATPELPPYTHSLFGVDRTPPNITAMSPPDSAVVAGEFNLFATIEDNLYIQDEMSVRYMISYLNGSQLYNGNMSILGGNTWFSDPLDFTFLYLEDLNFSVWANDSVDNTGFRNITFTINNETPWFDFGNISVNNLSAFDTIIDGDMFAYNVRNSSLRIIGPLPSTTQYFLQSQTDLLTTNHIYSGDIFVVTWPEGTYRVIFAGTNSPLPTNVATREFRVDHYDPEYHNIYPNNTILYANESVVLSVNWTDFSLSEVNISHFAGIWDTQTTTTTSSGNFTKGPIDLSPWINETFYWNSTAIDSFGRLVPINMSFFVASNPPLQTATIPNQTILEDASNISPTNLSLYLEDYFQDVNLGDALNYAIHDHDPNLHININDTTGEVLHLTGVNDFFGDVIVKLNISDSYGAWILANFTVHILPVNDSPRWVYPLGPIHTDEDNPGWVLVNLTGNVTDVEGDPIEWGIHLNTIDPNFLNLIWNDTSQGLFNFTLKPDENGEDNITFRITQDDGGHWVDEEIKIIIDPTADIPTKPVITNMTTSDVPVPPYTPNISSTVLGMIPITWNGSKDPDIETLNYSIEYSINGGSDWNLIVDEYGTIQSSHTSVPVSYIWNSTANLSNQDVTVYLRVNATVGPDEVESDMYGPIFVDNKPVSITFNDPLGDPVDVAADYIFVNVTTSDKADCHLYIENVWQGVSTDDFEHVFNISVVTNKSYIINVTCEDDLGNWNTTSKTIRLWPEDLVVISYSVNDTLVVQGDHVNFSMEVFSLHYVPYAELFLESPVGLAHYLNETNFSSNPWVNNRTNIWTTITNTTTLGYYNMTGIVLNNSQGDSFNIPDMTDLFRSVTWVQHQLIVE
ncbi:FG-GAP-like repeat-containing protein [Nanoarchaeota archaeon]